MRSRPPALLDECLDPALVPALRRRGFDVASLQSVGPRSVDDYSVMERSSALGRVLVTQNARHFKRLHAASMREEWAHGGVACVPQVGPLVRRELRIAMLLDWIATQEYAARLFVWGDLQRLLESGFRLPGYGEDDVAQALGRR